jgi:hypothetical protein
VTTERALVGGTDLRPGTIGKGPIRNEPGPQGEALKQPDAVPLLSSAKVQPSGACGAHLVRGIDAAGARFVIHDQAVPELVAQLLGNAAGSYVGNAARRERQDQPGRRQRAGAAFNADIGLELPSSVELRPVPNDVAVRVAQTDGYLYAVADDRVLLVAPVNRVVVGVFMDDVQSPKPDGTRRTP